MEVVVCIHLQKARRVGFLTRNAGVGMSGQFPYCVVGRCAGPDGLVLVSLSGARRVRRQYRPVADITHVLQQALNGPAAVRRLHVRAAVTGVHTTPAISTQRQITRK